MAVRRSIDTSVYLRILRVRQWLHKQAPVSLMICAVMSKLRDDRSEVSFAMAIHFWMLQFSGQMF